MDPGTRRRLRLEIVGIAGGGALLAVGSFFAYAKGCDAGTFICADQDVGRYPSPDGNIEVRVYVRDCGATTTWATHATVTRKRKLFPNISTLVFVADGNHGVAPQGPGYGPEVRVRWLDDNKLVVAHHKDAAVHRSTSEVDGVAIEYQRFE